jgi:hypothetical protein
MLHIAASGVRIARPAIHDARGRPPLLRWFIVHRLSMSISLIVSTGAVACVTMVPSPFGDQDAGDQDVVPASDAEQDVDGDAVSGKVCTIDEDCDDQVDCTFDRCDPSTYRCTHTPDDLPCQDGRYCNGVEKCDLKSGCGMGTPITCSDLDSCTIDRCIEQSLSCTHELRDVDGDGDPDWHCTGGGDCNDLDPLVNSKEPEICANEIDDNCDGQVDEEPCTSAQHDTCSDPLILESGKTVSVSPAGAKLDYGASCVPAGSPTLRDIVGAIAVPAGSPQDLDVIATVSQNSVYAATATQCADPSTEIVCSVGASSPSVGWVARFVARGLTEGSYPVYVWTDSSQDILLTATLRASEPKPTNETCGTAQMISPDTQITAEIFDCTRDLGTACTATPGDLVYSFELTEPQDVRVYASSLDGIGNPVIGLRDSGCVDIANELSCRAGTAPVVFMRSLPAATYYLDVSASAPSVVQFSVMLSPPTQAPADETCATAPLMDPNKTISVSLQDHTDDVKNTCLASAPDAAYELSLGEASDVLIVGRVSQGDYGAVSLMNQDCGPADLLVCATNSTSPVRASMHDAPAGTYKVVIETQKGDPTQLTTFVRPAQPPVFMLFAETCSDAQTIPLEGGFFQGNTSNAVAHYGAGCDQAGGPAAGAPDQMLRLELNATKRVVFDMHGSDYRTLLDVRKGPDCPGQELTSGCSVGYYEERSYVDLVLEAGQYWVQVDGLNCETGQWFLDVFLADP